MTSVSKGNDKIRVLFVCVHNSARSQMAEAFLNRLAGDRFDAESAGLEPGELNPLAVEVMQEVGIDISKNKTKSALDLYKQDRSYGYVVTVCDEANGERCPILPTFGTSLHWSFEDPSSFTGRHEERLESTRKVRDEIERKIGEFVVDHGPEGRRP
jgi:arsenate reductase (thioredoxin)